MSSSRSATNEPAWVEHAIWWQPYPLGFLGAEPENTGQPVQHRLTKLIDWLDYAVELGASGLALGPIFDSETHGYDTIDHFRIDPRLGDEADFDALIAAARARGVSILLDGVFNHVGRAFPAFQRVLREGSRAPDASWFRQTGATPEGKPEFATFEGHDALVALNHDEPAVADYVARVMTRWLDRGAAGWRLDAAYAVPPRFWAAVLPRVRAAHPDAYVVGEVIHGDYSAIVQESTLDAVTQYETWKAIWSSLNDANFFELAWSLDRHNHYLEAFIPLTFVGNHDVTRGASLLTDARHLPHALVILLTIGGAPTIYYGDEQAFQGIKEERAGGDDAIRPAFPPEGPSGLAPFGWPTYRLHQELIGLRRRHPWLHRAQTTPIHLSNRQFIYESAAGGKRLVVALNLDDSPLDHAVANLTSVLAGDATLHHPAQPEARLTLPAHGWAIFD